MTLPLRTCPDGCHQQPLTQEDGRPGLGAGPCKLAKASKRDGWTVYEPSPACRMAQEIRQGTPISIGRPGVLTPPVPRPARTS